MFILLLLTFSLACEPQINFGSSSCVFYVSYPNAPQCSSFTFNKCTWKACARYSYDSSKSCTSKVTRENRDWNQCTNQCCEEDVTYPRTSDAIKQCQEYLDRGFLMAIIIVLSIFGGSLPIFVCICCCCRKKEPANGEVVGQAIEIEIQNTAMYLQPMWRFENVAHTRLGNVCSVCLDDRPSLQLQCGHVFHRKCIIECLRKKQECILCRTNSFNQVKVYCQNCFAAHYQTTLLEHMTLLENNRQVCDGCQEAGF